MSDVTTFELVTPEAQLARYDAKSVSIPGDEGDIGALPDHARVMTTLRPGVVKVERPDGTVDEYVISGGFAEITEICTSVIAELAVPKEKATREFIDRLIAEAEEELALPSGIFDETSLALRINDYRNLEHILGV